MAEEKERKLKEFTSCVDNAKTKNAESVKRLTDENKTLKSEVSSLKKQLTSIQKNMRSYYQSRCNNRKALTMMTKRKK